MGGAESTGDGAGGGAIGGGVICVAAGVAVFRSASFCSSDLTGTPAIEPAAVGLPEPFSGVRIPQKSVVASVNFSSTYPPVLPFCLVFTTWQTTSCLDFSLVTKSNWPGPTAAARRITAPLPNTSTVCVVSENGSRFSLPAMVLAPFTVTGISMATGCGFALTGAPVFVCPAISGSLVSGAISYLLALSKFFGRSLKRQNSAPTILL
jgi:hypothetical protein